MTLDDYRRYVAAFNARDYAALHAFFTDDVVLEAGGMALRGKDAISRFYDFFHAHARETVTIKAFFEGQGEFRDQSVANVIIRFLGLKDLTPELLAKHGSVKMNPVPKGVVVDVEFLIVYYLRKGLVHHIRCGVVDPVDPTIQPTG